MDDTHQRPKLRRWRWWTSGRIAGVSGLLATLAVVLTIGAPGITIDEPLDVRPGRTYVATLKARGLRFFERETVNAVFRDNAEHPPLGRWLLGIASTLGEPFEILIRGRDPVGLYIRAGRLAPALAFGALVGSAPRRQGGSTVDRGACGGTGIDADAPGVCPCPPRGPGHLHQLLLDLALISAARAIEGQRFVFWMGVAGLAWGLALLTKIHAWFLPRSS